VDETIVVNRPRQLVLVVGTGTAVGKTWVATQLLHDLRRRGLVVAARKPVQSFEIGDDRAATTDAQILAAASGEDPESICPPHRWYPIPMAPPMAADVLARPPFTIADLAAELSWPHAVDVGLIETAGGVRSPQAVDGDAIDLARAVVPDTLVVVGDAGLGTINAVRLTMDALAASVPGRLVVFLNHHDPASELHVRNRSWLADRADLPSATQIAALGDHLVVP
jgi:dethiobiotin synthetase